MIQKVSALPGGGVAVWGGGSALVVAAEDGHHLVAGEHALDDDGEFLLEVGHDLAQRGVLLLDHLSKSVR